MERGAIERSF
jgi:hypothetical protein